MRTTQTTLLLLMLLVSVAWAKPAAMVIDLKGKINSGTQELQLLDTLEPGTKIQVPAKAKIGLNFLVNGKRYTAQGPVSMEIELKGIRVLAGDKNSVQKIGGRNRSSSKNLNAVSLTMGAEFHRGSGMLMLPVGNVLTAHPSFNWTAHPEAELYRLEVLEGENSIYSAETEYLSLIMPKSEVALVPQKQYTVRLSSFIEDDEEEMQFLEKTEGTLRYVRDRALQKILEQTRTKWELKKIDRSLVVETAGQCLGAGLFQESLDLVQMLEPEKNPAIASLQNRIHAKIRSMIID